MAIWWTWKTVSSNSSCPLHNKILSTGKPYRNLQNKVQPYLDAMRHAPERVRNFFENLLAQKPERIADAPSKASHQKSAEL